MAADKETAFDHNMFLFYPRPSASSAVLLFLVVANGHIVNLCGLAALRQKNNQKISFFSVSRGSQAVFRLSFEEFAGQTRDVGRPVRIGDGIVADFTREFVHLGVEVVQMMQGDGFGRHR